MEHLDRVSLTSKKAEKACPTSHVEDARKEVDRMVADDSPEGKLLDNLRDDYSAAVAAKEPVQQQMLRGVKWYRTGQMDIPQFEGIDQELRANFIKTLVRNIRSRLSDKKPRPIAIPRLPDDWRLSKITDNTLQWVLDENDWEHKREELFYDCAVKGNAFSRDVWNPSGGRDGKGLPELEYIDAMRVFPGSAARTMQDQGSIFILRSEPLHKVATKFDGKNIEKKAAGAAGGPFPMGAGNDFFESRIPLSSFHEQRFEDESRKVFLTSEGSEKDGFDDNVNYVEAFIQYPPGHPLKDDYPDGRLVFFTHQAVLADYRWERERIPYTKYSFESEGSNFWNESLVLQVGSSQRAVNSIGSLVLQSGTRATHPPFLTPYESGLDDESLAPNEPGRILHVDPVAAEQSRYLDLPPFPDQAFQLREVVKGELEQQMGVHDISQGRTPGNLQSGEAIDLLQEAAQVIIRHYSRGLQKGLKNLGLNLIEQIQENFTQERTISVGDTKANEFITLNEKIERKDLRERLSNAEDVETQQQVQKEIQRIKQKQQRKSMIDDRIKRIVINDPSLAEVNIRVGVGGDRFSRVGKIKLAMKFFELGAITREDLLQKADWDNKEEIMDDLDEIENLTRQVKGLQRRNRNMVTAIKEALNNIEGQAKEQLLSAIQSATGTPGG